MRRIDRRENRDVIGDAVVDNRMPAVQPALRASDDVHFSADPLNLRRKLLRTLVDRSRETNVRGVNVEAVRAQVRGDAFEVMQIVIVLNRAGLSEYLGENAEASNPVSEHDVVNSFGHVQPPL